MTPYYSDDAVTIWHGDCREIDAWLSADVLVTDPPYGIGWSRGVNAGRADRGHEGIVNDHDTSARDAALAMAPELPAVVFGSLYAPRPARVRHVLIWQKPSDCGVVGSTTGYRRDIEPIYLLDPWPMTVVQWSSVIRSAVGGQRAYTTGDHPHAKPVDLMRTLITRAPAGVIADSFMGSGTTLRAAKDLGRKAVGVEIDERYCEVAAKRMGQEVLDLGAA